MALIVVPHERAADAPKARFDLRAEPAEQSLKSFAAQAGVEVLFATEAVARVRTQKVEGNFTPREAIDLMLYGSGLAAIQDERTGAIRVVPADPNGHGVTPVAHDVTPAQTTEARQPGKLTLTDRDGEIVQLNPFVVSTTGDVGYLAQNSISGSRLNSRLGDLAAPMTVFTPEFINDVAATSVDDLYVYMANTQVKYYEDADASFANDRKNATIRGLPGGRNSVNFFPSDLRMDMYNIDRADFSRGANSILFGMGSPGGIVNVSTKRAVTRNTFGSLSVQSRSWEGLRTAIDYNAPIFGDKLALRLNAVRDKRGTWRDNEWNDQDRIYLTLRWKVTPKTIVDVDLEHGLVSKFDAPAFVARDGYTIWANAGKQTYTSGAYNAAAGLKNIGNGASILFNMATGVAMDWQKKATTIPKNIDGTAATLTDFSVLPKTVYPLGFAFPQNTNYSRESVFITHSITPNLNLEVAAMADYADRYVLTGAANSNILQVDPNVTLPTGAPNPNVGRAYFEGHPTQNFSHTRNAAIRGTLSYQHDFGRWFGRHFIAGLVEQDNQHFTKRQDHLAILDNPFNTSTPENPQNTVRFQTYVDLNGPSENIRWLDWRNVPLTNMKDVVSGRTFSLDWFNFSTAGGADNRFTTKSAMAVLQSYWLKDRLITVLGYRRDEQHGWYSPVAVRAPNTGKFAKFAVGDYAINPGQNDFLSTANNRSISGVLRVTRWLNLTYNHAENVALPSPTAALPNDTGGRAPNPEGRSQDIGMKIDIGRRLYVAASYYESSAKNDFQGGTNATGSAEDYFNDIWKALELTRVPLPGGKSSDAYQTRGNGYNLDSKSHGYELELIANPTDQWRVFLNLSNTTVVQTNLGRDARNYLAKYRDFWLQGTNGRVLLDGTGLAPVADDGSAVIDTVAKAIRKMDQAFYSGYVLPDGRKPLGQFRYQGNLRTNYAFATGKLRGVSVGAGVRAQSAPVTGYVIATHEARYAKSNALYDFNLGYANRLNWGQRRIRWNLQLNINNVLNDTSIRPLRTSIATGETVTYRLQTPREFVLTSKFEF